MAELYGNEFYGELFSDSSTRDGRSIEPIVMSGRTESGYQPIDSQMDWLAERAISWSDLGRINNSMKKVAIIITTMGRQDNIEGCYLNVLEP